MLSEPLSMCHYFFLRIPKIFYEEIKYIVQMQNISKQDYY